MTLKCSVGLLRWGGTPSPFGDVNRSRRCGKSAGLFIFSVLPNGGEQSVATEVDGKAHGYFKDAYGPPEYFVGKPNSLVLTDYRFEVTQLTPF